MVRVVRQTRVAAPFDAVWALHDRLDGFTELAPAALGLEVIPLDGPNAPLQAGTNFAIEVAPLGVARRRIWRGRVTSVRRRPDRGRFVDVGLDTPFDHWRHVHTVKAEPAETRIVDDITVRGPPGDGAGRVALRTGVALGLWDRRRRLRARFGSPDG